MHSTDHAVRHDPDPTTRRPHEPAWVSPSVILRSAATYLDRHGWIQGSYYDATATVFTPAACLVGALGMVCYGGPVDAPALNFADPGWPDFDDAMTVVDAHLQDAYGLDVYSFNDTKGRTREQVIAALRAAAADWDATIALLSVDDDADEWGETTGGAA